MNGKIVVAFPATQNRAIPNYVKRNLEYYLNREAEGDFEASRTIAEISQRWGI